MPLTHHIMLSTLYHQILSLTPPPFSLPPSLSLPLYPPLSLSALDCRMACHPKCRCKAPLPCVPCVPTPKKKLQNLDLAAFCPHNIPRVPAIIVHCVNEIEKRGLNSVGLYRISG